MAVDRYVVVTILKSMGFPWVVGQVEDIAWTLMDLIKPESERAVFFCELHGAFARVWDLNQRSGCHTSSWRV